MSELTRVSDTVKKRAFGLIELFCVNERNISFLTAKVPVNRTKERDALHYYDGKQLLNERFHMAKVADNLWQNVSIR